MTNPTTVPDLGAELSPELPVSAPVGGTRRPVKIVEHPAFRAARARRHSPFTVLPVALVSLHGATVAAICPRRGAGSTIATTSLEAG
jgi:hypothetical protein